MERVREVGIEPTETEALLLAMAIGVFRAKPLRSQGTPIPSLSLSVFSWARGERLPVKCAPLSVGGGDSFLKVSWLVYCRG